MEEGLGFPNKPLQTSATPTQEQARSYAEYTIPIDVAEKSLDWEHSGFGEGDLIFRMISLSSAEQDLCFKRSGGNQSRLTRELVFAAVWQVGDWKTRSNRDKLKAWYEAIGGGGKRLVDAAFMALNSVEEEDVDTFLSEATRGFGS